MSGVFYLSIIIAAAAGYIVARYIYRKKIEAKPLICPLRSDCQAVVKSEFSRFLGIPVEILGMFYYGLIFAAYLAFLFLAPFSSSSFLSFSILTVTTLAFLFSVYLTFIQAFALKQWCAWCLLSAGLCAVIFAAALAASGFKFVNLLDQYRQLILMAHLAGVALGVGGATVAGALFIKFLKDLRISRVEKEALDTLSQLVWFALGIIVIAGVGLYLPQAAALNQTPKFLAKALALAVIIVNGSVLNLLIAPHLTKISFGQHHRYEVGELKYLHRLSFALGAVSITSWYAALIFALLPANWSVDFWVLALGYVLAVSAAVLVSQIFDRRFTVRRRDETPVPAHH